MTGPPPLSLSLSLSLFVIYLALFCTRASCIYPRTRYAPRADRPYRLRHPRDTRSFFLAVSEHGAIPRASGSRLAFDRSRRPRGQRCGSVRTVAITIGPRISKYHDRSASEGLRMRKGPRRVRSRESRLSRISRQTRIFLRYPPVKILARAFLAAAAAVQGWRTGSQRCYRSVFSSIVPPPRRVQMRVSLSLSLSNTVEGPAN